MKTFFKKSIYLVGALLLITNCTGEKPTVEKPDLDSIEVLPEVVFAEVDGEPLRFFIESRGVVEPIQRITLIPRVSGYVEEHSIIAGKQIKKGALLLEFDVSEWENSKEDAHNQYLKAKNLYDVEIRLREKDGSSTNGNDGYRITTGLADAELAYERAKLNLSYTKIIAPFSGVISTKEVISKGAYISAGKELGTLVNTSKMRVRFDVLESEITSLKPGMKVELTDPSGKEFTGEIVAISPEIDQKTKTGQAIVEVNNEDGNLKSGMTVEGKVFVNSIVGKVRMPRAALLERDGRTLIFKLYGTEVEWIYVTPEAMNNEWVIINHEEINPGDTLAVDKHFSISHQQEVIPLMAN